MAEIRSSTPARTHRCATWVLAMSIAAHGAELRAATLPAVPLYREFGAWVVACDNVRRCTLKSLDNAGGDTSNDVSGTAVVVTREAGPHATPDLSIEAEHASNAMALALDDRPVDTPMPWPGRSGGDASLGGEPALSLVRHMRSAGTLAFSLPEGQAHLSLRGLAAALRTADAAQGRTGNVTAMFAAGPASSNGVPPLPAMPAIRTARPPPDLHGAARLLAAARRTLAGTLKARDCPPDTDEPGWARPLDARHAIVAIGCELGAYQGWALLAVVPRAAPAQARVLRLPLPPGEPPGRDKEDGSMLRLSGWAPRRGILMEPDYDPRTATLRAEVLGRGLRDCGMSASWVFNGQVFQPSLFAMQNSCGSLNQDWPVLFRTRRAHR